MINYFRIGIVVSTHGLKGELKIHITSDDIKRFDNLQYVYLIKNNLDFIDDDLFKNNPIYKIENVKYIKNIAIVKFENINTIDEASKFIKYEVFVDRKNAIPLLKNEYYIPDLINLKVIDDNQNNVGTVLDVVDNLNQPKIIVLFNNKKYMIPMVKEFVKKIDIDNKFIEVKLIQGLIENDI